MKLSPLVLSLFMSVLVLSACGTSVDESSTTEEDTVVESEVDDGMGNIAYKSVDLSYDPAAWKPGESGMFTSGLQLQMPYYVSSDCWIETVGAQTTPSDASGYDVTEEGALTVYTVPGADHPAFVAFAAGSETVYGSVSAGDEDACMAAYQTLAEGNK